MRAAKCRCPVKHVNSSGNIAMESSLKKVKGLLPAYLLKK